MKLNSIFKKIKNWFLPKYENDELEYEKRT